MRYDDSKSIFEAYVTSRVKPLTENAPGEGWSKPAAEEAEETTGCQCPCCKSKQMNEDEECECESGHAETDLSNPEEAHEVRIGKSILDLCRQAHEAGHHFEEEGKIEKLAQELISMHMK